MKRCPECSNTYPDAERFCSSDGAALVPADSAPRATVQMPAPGAPEPPIECPVCGGKALPGEEVCSFCGTRLGVVETPPPPPSRTTYTPSFETPKQTGAGRSPTQVTLQHTFDDEPPSTEEPSGFRRFFAWTGYLLAAMVALAAGAWFALHLSSTGIAPKPAPPAASPAASPGPVSGPIAALATNTPVQVTGESASDPARNVDAAGKLFNDNSATVLDTYKRALAGDGSLSDGALATLTVNPGGEVVAGSIKTSTASNPALDGELIKTMMGWHFAPFGGSSVEVSYPVVLARDSADKAAVESALADKIAHLNPGETPEYASAPPLAASASPAPEASPAIAAREPITPPAMAPVAPPMAPPAPEPYRPRRRRHREAPAYAPPRPPAVDLLTRVQDRLHSDRRFGRVKAYTNGGGVVTLYGKVFDAKIRRSALAAIRGVDGVTDVIDSMQTDTAAWAQQEAAISAQLQGAGLSQVTVKVIGKDAYLDGQVSTEAQKEHAVTIAEGAAPVRVRTNLIRVVPKGVFSF